LHFEVDVGDKTTDPTPYQDKIFRFGGSVKVKPKAKPQQNIAGQTRSIGTKNSTRKTQNASHNSTARVMIWSKNMRWHGSIEIILLREEELNLLGNR
jgi:hypothetical protein